VLIFKILHTILNSFADYINIAVENVLRRKSVLTNCQIKQRGEI